MRLARNLSQRQLRNIFDCNWGFSIHGEKRETLEHSFVFSHSAYYTVGKSHKAALISIHHSGKDIAMVDTNALVPVADEPPSYDPLSRAILWEDKPEARPDVPPRDRPERGQPDTSSRWESSERDSEWTEDSSMPEAVYEEPEMPVPCPGSPAANASYRRPPENRVNRVNETRAIEDSWSINPRLVVSSFVIGPGDVEDIVRPHLRLYTRDGWIKAYIRLVGATHGRHRRVRLEAHSSNRSVTMHIVGGNLKINLELDLTDQ